MFGATGHGYDMRNGLPRQKPKHYTVHTKFDDPCIGELRISLGKKTTTNVTIINMQYIIHVPIYITQYQYKYAMFQSSMKSSLDNA